MGEYVGTSVKAKEWHVSKTTVSRWCREDKISGAEQDGKGKPWRIPKDAVKPQ